ncbi:hypothetical protein NDU88_000861 [Pleurodeles waltl]|uniref:Uncharacterized protein n=1 Tax=Pleurodeles waltl TaxID=8319 RepID=A0AAV7S767_PLEWA|nr:hypothetical protein NDU88_000861 [Pleurodeles waltl]
MPGLHAVSRTHRCSLGEGLDDISIEMSPQSQARFVVYNHLGLEPHPCSLKRAQRHREHNMLVASTSLPPELRRKRNTLLGSRPQTWQHPVC